MSVMRQIQQGSALTRRTATPMVRRRAIAYGPKERASGLPATAVRACDLGRRGKVVVIQRNGAGKDTCWNIQSRSYP